MPDIGQTLVKLRDATIFPTDQAVCKALCDIGAEPGTYFILRLNHNGWLAQYRATGEWLKMPTDEPRDMRAYLREVSLMPILSALVAATGPANLAATLAEVARERASSPEHDRDFWRIVRTAFQIAAKEIDIAAESLGSNTGEN